jgi:excisionase family DNA binding protein
MSKLISSHRDEVLMMTVHEVATYLRVSKATVYKWAKTREIPALKIGGVWRFEKKAVEEWMKREAFSSTAIP